MRPFVAEVWDDRERLVQRVAMLVTTTLPTYRASPSSEVWIGMNRILERSVLGDAFGSPDEADRAAAYGTGVQGAAAGISAEDLVSAVLLGAREVESAVLARARAAGVDAEVLFEASGLSRVWAEQVAVWAAEGLGRADRRRSDDERLVGKLVAALRDRRPSAEVRAAGDRIGIDLAAPRYVVVARGSGDVFGVDAATLRFSHPGEAVWVDEPGQLIGLVVDRPGPVGGLVIGLSEPGVLGELPDRIRDAERAGRIAAQLADSGVHTLDSLGLLAALYDDPQLAERLRRRWFVPLAAEAKHDLVATVRLWQSAGGSVDETARLLTVHPNTVRNRLARVERVLGPQWRTPKAQAELWAALAVG